VIARLLGGALAALLALPLPARAADADDLWLEDGASAAVRQWVAARNAETEARLLPDPRYAEERRRFLSLGGGRHEEDYLNGGLVHRLRSDASRPLGRWQVRAAGAAARRLLGDDRWHTMLDLDALARAEGRRWTFPLWWKNPMCDTSIGPRCMVNLSPDGGDRTVLREFDLKTRRFVANGFRSDTPARHYAHWVDADRLLLASDFGPGSLSDAGYARQARVWRRGTPLADALQRFEAPADAVLFIPHNFRHAGGTLFVAEVWHRSAGAPSWVFIDPERGATPFVPPVELVRYRGLAGIVGERLVATTAQPFTLGDRSLPAGSLLALPLPGRSEAIEPIFVPAAGEAVDPVFHLAVAQDALWFGVMHDVSGRLVRATRGTSGWSLAPQPVPPHGAVRLLTGEIAPSSVLVKTESLLGPPQTTRRDGRRIDLIAQQRAAFDASRCVTEQRFATSRDGTLVPYYVTRTKQAPQRPPAAVLSAYGGFGISFLPTYLNPEFHTDLVWPLLARGAIHVHANIRGGGEYGPAWHRGAQRRERMRGVEDLVAVAEDLVRAGLADPKRLGFIGASNGGLLAAATAVQRPDLFRAVVADVPITDMLRFHELFTGAVWIDEYGDPREPADRAALERLSPLHNLRAGVTYPEMLVTTSGSDDRVHPGHARRFAERLRRLGNPVLFHESSDTGHGASAALDAAAARRALKTTYLLQTLDLGEAPR